MLKYNEKVIAAVCINAVVEACEEHTSITDYYPCLNDACEDEHLRVDSELEDMLQTYLGSEKLIDIIYQRGVKRYKAGMGYVGKY